MKKILILGSCVSRDIFRLYRKDFQVVGYYARSSLVSIMSNPINIDINRINLNSDFQRRMVYNDFRKTFFESVEKNDFDFLLIDFIDERFHLLKQNEIYVTRTNELVNSKLLDSGEYCFKLINRNQKITYALWETSCGRFIDKLKRSIPDDKILLHQAYWSNSYVDGADIIKFDRNMTKQIKQNNRILERYYRFFKAKAPNIRILESSEKMSDKHHDWGLAPNHYVPDYYKDIYNQLLRIAT